MSTSEEIRQTWDKHPPYRRVTSGEPLALDRQWLRMLDEIFKDVSHEDLVRLGLSAMEATEFLGIIALRSRLCED